MKSNPLEKLKNTTRTDHELMQAHANREQLMHAIREQSRNVVMPFFDELDGLRARRNSIGFDQRTGGDVVDSLVGIGQIEQNIQEMDALLPTVLVSPETEDSAGIAARIGRDPDYPGTIELSLFSVRDGRIAPRRGAEFLIYPEQPDEVYFRDEVTRELTRYEIGGERVGIGEDYDPVQYSEEYATVAFAYLACAEELARGQRDLYGSAAAGEEYSLVH